MDLKKNRKSIDRKIFGSALVYLIKGTANSWPHNETQTKKCLQAGKGGSDVIREFLGDNGEAGGEKCRISYSLDDSNHERKDYKGIMAVHLVQQTEEDGAGSCR